MSDAVFKFTYGGQLFEIFEEGRVQVTPSQLPSEATIVVNRLPLLRSSTITPALDAAAEREPVAWRIRVRERGGTTYHIYTERLPFEPDADSGIIAIGKAVPVFALDDIHWNEIRSAVTQQFEKTLEYLGKTEKE